MHWRRKALMLVSLTLGALMHACAPSVGPRTLAAVVAYESGGRAAAISDNSARRSYYPASTADAEELATRLLGSGHDLDLGLMQINVRNVRRLRLTLRDAFDPCANLAAGSRILDQDYARAVRRFGPGQRALFHALSAYNAGTYWSGTGYARNVYRMAKRLRFAPQR